MMAFAENVVGGFWTNHRTVRPLQRNAVVIILVLLMPPWRPTGWLGKPDAALTPGFDQEPGAPRHALALARRECSSTAQLIALYPLPCRASLTVQAALESRRRSFWRTITRSCAAHCAQDPRPSTSSRSWPEAGAVDEAVRRVLAYKPSVIVLDLTCPEGRKAWKQLSGCSSLENSAGAAIIVLTMESLSRVSAHARHCVQVR